MSQDTSQLAPIGGPLNRIVGPVLVSATAGISPTCAIHHVSGTAVISLISQPYAGFQGTITLIPDGVFTTVTSGTASGLALPVALASTAVVSKAMQMYCDGANWYPSY